MKLKLVVASMSILGLVSCPVFAAHGSKHKHHHRHHTVSDYKDMGNLPAKDQPVCMISQNTMILTSMDQNMGRSLPNPCNPGWFNRIAMSGGINVDLGKFGNRNGAFMGENYQRFSLNDAYFNVAADVNEWAKAFASLSYGTPTINAPASALGATIMSEYSAAYSNNITGALASSTVQLEQAFATFGNLDEYPVFLQIGKQFQDYSRYEIHPITRSFTQVVSETLATSAQLGFITNGFHGDIFAFDDPLAKVGKTSTTTNYGAALGYDAPSDTFGWDIGAGYMYNMIGVNDVAYMVNQINVSTTGIAGYNTRVGATALYGDLNYGPFTLGARYTTALQRFNITDLPKNGTATSTTGAKPWAAGAQAGYGFEGWGKNQNVYLGYQASRESAGLGLPKYRWLVGYGVDMFGRNTNLGIEWDHDGAFNTANGGSGNNTNLVSVRSSVKFG